MNKTGNTNLIAAKSCVMAFLMCYPCKVFHMLILINVKLSGRSENVIRVTLTRINEEKKVCFSIGLKCFDMSTDAKSFCAGTRNVLHFHSCCISPFSTQLFL